MSFNFKTPSGKRQVWVGSGASLPSAISDILQWGIGTDDGLIVNDKISPLVVDPEAAYVNRPVVALDGVGDYVTTPIFPDEDCSITLHVNINSVSALGDREGFGAADTTNDRRFYFGTKDNKWFLTYGNSTLYDSVGSASTGEHTLVFSGGILTVDGVVAVDGSAGGFAGISTEPILLGKISTWFADADIYDCVIECGGVTTHYTFEETEGITCFDVSGNSNHSTITTSDIATMRAARADGVSSWCVLNGFTLLENLYTVTEPTGGWVYALDMNTAILGDIYDLVATMIYEAKNTQATFTITNNTSSTTLNPNSYMINNLYDASGTIADELWSGFSSYTITEPTGGWLRTFNPNTATNDELAEVLATFIEDATT